MKWLCGQNYKTLLKDIKEGQKWRANPSLWMGKFNAVNISFLVTKIYTFSAIPPQNANIVFK